MKSFNTAIILAGGKSTRMGFDKGLLKIGNRFLIDITIEKLKKYFDEIIIVNNKTNIYNNDNLIVVEDEIKNVGPLGGIHAGLKYSSSKFNYIIACDMPYINEDYIKFMIERLKNNYQVDVLVTKLGNWIEPFNSFYSKNIVKDIEKHIFLQKRSVYSLLSKLNTIYIEEETARKFSPSWKMFDNLNTKDDLENYYREIIGSVNYYAI